MKIIWTFTLLMIPVGAMTSLNVTGHSGGEINITCTYQGKHGNEKYFCKVPWLITCSDLIKTEVKNKWVDSGRFSLYDDTRAEVFTVIFRNLSEEDSGTYYCAVDKSWARDSYTEVNLYVITAPKTPPSVSSPSSSVPTPPISLISQPSTSDFTWDSPSVSNGLSLIIVGSVVVPLLIAGLVSCILTVFMKRQARAKGSESASKMPEPGIENNDAVPQTQYIYEEIKDTRPHTGCKTAQFTHKPL
ncbi:CMRF35-like molecule 2 [Carassius auratus]|uniref:CMRF35-like molecule 2 n=1 Tax=Carassius auratus TaxID=7957 RepID=A0A6P6NNQ1_CARAU|nr:CMRF35-like molecule 2 [Carassius auratus]